MLCDSSTWLEFGAIARCCLAAAMVVTSKVGASDSALGVRQVLRTMVARSAIKVEKLWAGVPSASRCCRRSAVERLPEAANVASSWNATCAGCTGGISPEMR